MADVVQFNRPHQYYYDAAQYPPKSPPSLSLDLSLGGLFSNQDHNINLDMSLSSVKIHPDHVSHANDYSEDPGGASPGAGSLPPVFAASLFQYRPQEDNANAVRTKSWQAAQRRQEARKRRKSMIEEKQYKSGKRGDVWTLSHADDSAEANISRVSSCAQSKFDAHEIEHDYKDAQQKSICPRNVEADITKTREKPGNPTFSMFTYGVEQDVSSGFEQNTNDVQFQSLSSIRPSCGHTTPYLNAPCATCGHPQTELVTSSVNGMPTCASSNLLHSTGRLSPAVEVAEGDDDERKSTYGSSSELESECAVDDQTSARKEANMEGEAAMSSRCDNSNGTFGYPTSVKMPGKSMAYTQSFAVMPIPYPYAIPFQWGFSFPWFVQYPPPTSVSEVSSVSTSASVQEQQHLHDVAPVRVSVPLPALRSPSVPCPVSDMENHSCPSYPSYNPSAAGVMHISGNAIFTGATSSRIPSEIKCKAGCATGCSEDKRPDSSMKESKTPSRLPVEEEVPEAAEEKPDENARDGRASKGTSLLKQFFNCHKGDAFMTSKATLPSLYRERKMCEVPVQLGEGEISGRQHSLPSACVRAAKKAKVVRFNSLDGAARSSQDNPPTRMARRAKLLSEGSRKEVSLQSFTGDDAQAHSNGHGRSDVLKWGRHQVEGTANEELGTMDQDAAPVQTHSTPIGAATAANHHNPCNKLEGQSLASLQRVLTRGSGPDGRTIHGVMYMKKGKQVRLICRCHGEDMSPLEFVQHSGSTDLSNPERSIVLALCQTRLI